MFIGVKIRKKMTKNIRSDEETRLKKLRGRRNFYGSGVSSFIKRVK